MERERAAPPPHRTHSVHVLGASQQAHSARYASAHRSGCAYYLAVTYSKSRVWSNRQALLALLSHHRRHCAAPYRAASRFFRHHPRDVTIRHPHVQYFSVFFATVPALVMRFRRARGLQRVFLQDQRKTAQSRCAAPFPRQHLAPSPCPSSCYTAFFLPCRFFFFPRVCTSFRALCVAPPFPSVPFFFSSRVYTCSCTVLPQAFAKQHGSYDAISGGHVCEAFEALTGAPTETVTLGA